MIGRSLNRLRIPNISRLTAFVFGLFILYGSARAIFLTGVTPLPGPLIAALISIAVLARIKVGKNGFQSVARLGFYIGLFAYFLSMPLLYPETIEAGFAQSIHQIMGWMLVLTIVGFEIGYQ